MKCKCNADTLCSLLLTPAWDFFCLLHKHAECNTTSFAKSLLVLHFSTFQLLFK